MSETQETNPSDDTQTEEPKYTDADIQRIVQTRLAKESKKLSAAQEQIQSLQEQASAAAELQARIAELEAAAEDAGKTAVEKAQSQANRELEKLRRSFEDSQKAIAERDQMIATQRAAFQQERAERAVLGAVSTHKVVDSSAAARLALVEVEINHGDDGEITASYGDVIDGSVSDAIDAWIKDRPMFLPAPAGGAGTRNGVGGGGVPLHKLSVQERMKAARR